MVDILSIAGSIAGTPSSTDNVEGLIRKLSQTEVDAASSAGAVTGQTLLGSALSLLSQNKINIAAFEWLEPIETTTSTVFQQRITMDLSAQSLPNGLYLLFTMYGWNHDAQNNDFEGRIMADPDSNSGFTQLGQLHKQEPKDAAGGGDPTGTTQRYFFSRVWPWNVTAVNNNPTFQLEYRTDANGAESSIWESALILIQVPNIGPLSL